jgi:hypothetical protein
MTILSNITGEEKIFHGKIYIKIYEIDLWYAIESKMTFGTRNNGTDALI